jgi:Uma2 family endonuclease
MVEPDLFAIPVTPGALPRAWEEVGRLLLAVEVLSPSTVRTDRDEKRELYQRKNVPEYWVVDVDNRRVERWTPNAVSAEPLTSTLEWRPDRLTEPLVVDLPQYFARVTGEPPRHALRSRT